MLGPVLSTPAQKQQMFHISQQSTSTPQHTKFMHHSFTPCQNISVCEYLTCIMVHSAEEPFAIKDCSPKAWAAEDHRGQFFRVALSADHFSFHDARALLKGEIDFGSKDSMCAIGTRGAEVKPSCAREARCTPNTINGTTLGQELPTCGWARRVCGCSCGFKWPQVNLKANPGVRDLSSVTLGSGRGLRAGRGAQLGSWCKVDMMVLERKSLRCDKMSKRYILTLRRRRTSPIIDLFIFMMLTCTG